MAVIPDASAETLLPWVESSIENGSKIYTDGWKGYNGLKALGYSRVITLQTHKGRKTGSGYRSFISLFPT
ncbi:MAG: transposase [Bacteroidales bacterium]|nr:transposase [Bacteroidales bacterium]